VRAAQALEVPPGDAVLHPDHARLGAEQRRDLRQHRRDLVGLERDDHAVDVAYRGHVAGGGDLRREVTALGQDLDAAPLAHRGEVRAAGDQRDFRPTPG